MLFMGEPTSPLSPPLFSLSLRVVSLITVSEGFVTDYMWCGGAAAPLTSGNGIYFDGTPCFDVKTDGMPISAHGALL